MIATLTIIITLHILLLVLKWLAKRSDQEQFPCEAQARAQNRAQVTQLRAEIKADGRLIPKASKLPHYGKPTLKPEDAILAPKPLALDIAATIPQQRPPDITLTPKPPILTPTKAEIRSLASKYKADDEMELDLTKYLYREIMEHGGICRYKNDYLKEEYESNVPVHYRRKDGLPPDEMASELMYDSDSELYTDIQTAERHRKSLKPRPFSAYLKEAKQDLEENDL